MVVVRGARNIGDRHLSVRSPLPPSVWVPGRGRLGTRRQDPAMASPVQIPHDLATRLQGWVGLGLITRAQADRILAVERGEHPAPARRPASILAEALGYVGGVLILVATAVLVGRFWADLSVTGRLVVT